MVQWTRWAEWRTLCRRDEWEGTQPWWTLDIPNAATSAGVSSG